MASLPPFTPGALISDGEPVNANVTNRPIQPLINRMYEVVDYNEVVVTGNYTVQQNKDVMIYVNNSLAVTITLPLAQNQFIHKRIRIRKVSSNLSNVYIVAPGGNSLESRFRPLENAAVVLKVPGDEVELEPQNTVWRVNNINLPRDYTGVGLVSSSSQSVSTSLSNLVMDNANNNDFNPLGLWSYGGNYFLAPYNGTYVLSYAVLLGSGTNYRIVTFLDNPLQQTSYDQNFNGGTTAIVTHMIYMEAGRYLRIRISTTGGNGSYTNRRVNIAFLG